MTHPDLIFYGAVPWIIGHAVGCILHYLQWTELGHNKRWPLPPVLASSRREHARWALLFLFQLALPYAMLRAIREALRGGS